MKHNKPTHAVFEHFTLADVEWVRDPVRGGDARVINRKGDQICVSGGSVPPRDEWLTAQDLVERGLEVTDHPQGKVNFFRAELAFSPWNDRPGNPNGESPAPVNDCVNKR